MIEAEGIEPTGLRFDPQPVTLEGRHVRLEPLHVGHAEDLYRAGAAPSIWTYMPRPPLRDVDDTVQWIREAQSPEAGDQLAFAIIVRASGLAVGSTRYLNIRRRDRGLEIGYTWLATAHQRTAVNTECKLLLLSHAFDALGAVRVELKTDGRNERSQRAIARLGAVREGVRRAHMILWNGVLRDSVYYSITAEEWPGIQRTLRRRLAGGVVPPFDPMLEDHHAKVEQRGVEQGEAEFE